MRKALKFDLSSADGVAAAKEGLSILGWGATMLVPGGALVALGKYVFDNFFGKPAEVVSAQSQAAADLIRAGRENGASEIEVTLSEQAGAHFKATQDIPVEFGLGRSGTVTLKVKYGPAA